MKKYEELVNFIIKNVGGKENILDVTHCVTRLRFKLKDDSKANDEVIKSSDGVITVMRTAGQYQVVIGNHVPDVYAELLPLLNLSERNEKEEKMSFKDKVLDLISGIFFPSLSVLCASGMIKGINVLLPMIGLYGAESDLATLIAAIGDAIFYFFPIVIGYNTAKKIKMNPFTGMIIGAALVYPSIQDVDLSLFGLSVNVNYTATVLPVIVTCFIAAPIEKFFNKVLPDAIKTFMTPTFVLLIAVILGFTCIGPLVNTFSNYISIGMLSLYDVSPVIAGFIFGALWIIFVLFGVHITFIVLCIINLSQGIADPLLGASTFSAFVITGLVFAIFVKTKNKSLKSTSLSAAISGFFGVTEPALYGVLISRPVMFAVACIGSGIVGAAHSVLGLKYQQMAGLGIFEIPAFIDPVNVSGSLTKAIILSVISTVIGFVAAYFLFKDDKDTVKEKTVEVRNDEIASPVDGKVVQLSEVKDDAFASGALGKGCAVLPTSGKVVAPFDGTVLVMFPTGHAVGIVDDNGCEVLIHIGVNTVELEGKYFTKHVNVGDKVKKGQLLVEFDREEIEKAGYNTDTMVIVTNTRDYKNIATANEGTVKAGEPILVVEA